MVSTCRPVNSDASMAETERMRGFTERGLRYNHTLRTTIIADKAASRHH